MSKKIIYYWASDLRIESGEGILANKYLGDLKKQNKKYKFIPLNNNKKENYNSIYSKYFKPFYSILKINFHNLNGYKTCYINYLPLWNFFLFILLPKNTILGPVTGTVYNKNQNLFLKIRYKFLIYFFYKISLFFIFNKWNKINFSTNMLQDQIPKKYLKKCSFNYVLKNFKQNLKTKKNNKILFYFRKHPTKYNHNLISNLEILSKDIKIDVIGETLKSDIFYNYGKVSKKKYENCLKNYQYTFNGLENLYSLHLINSVKNNLTIFCDINLKKFYNGLRSSKIIFIDFSDKNLHKKLIKIINN